MLGADAAVTRDSESGFILYSEGQNGIIYSIWRVTVDGDGVGCIATIPRASVSDSSYVAGNWTDGSIAVL